MAADFNFYGGGGTDQEALAHLLAAAIAGANQSADIQARGYQGALDATLGGLNQGLNRRAAQRIAVERNALEALLSGRSEDAAMAREQLQQTSEDKRNAARLSSEETQAGLARSAEDDRRRRELAANIAVDRFRILGQLGDAAAQQGVPAPAIMDRLMQMMGSSPELQQAAGQAPGVPGGYQIQAPSQDGGYQKLQSGAPQDFGDLKPVPKPAPWEQQRYGLDKAEADQLAQAGGEIESFAMSPEGRKAFHVQVPMTAQDAYGWSHLMPAELEKAVIGKWPEVAPTTTGLGPDAKVDRTALDAQLKWLKQKMPQEVLSGPAIVQMREQAMQKYPPRVVDEALKGYFKEHGRPATTMAEAKELAKAKLVAQIESAHLGPHPAGATLQAGSMSQLLGNAEQAQLGQAVAAAPQGAYLNDNWISERGGNLKQIPRALSTALSLGYDITPDFKLMSRDASGRAVAAPKQYQDAFDEFLNSNPAIKKRAQAMSGTPQQARSPDESKKMGLMAPTAPAQPAARATRSGGEGAPSSGGARPVEPSSPGWDDLDAYRERVKKEMGKTSAPKKPPVMLRSKVKDLSGVPPSLDTIGLDRQDILDALSRLGRPR